MYGSCFTVFSFWKMELKTFALFKYIRSSPGVFIKAFMKAFLLLVYHPEDVQVRDNIIHIL